MISTGDRDLLNMAVVVLTLVGASQTNTSAIDQLAGLSGTFARKQLNRNVDN